MKNDSQQQQVDQIEEKQQGKTNKREQKYVEFQNIGKNKQIITDASIFYATLQKCGKTFKSVRNVHPKLKDLTIIDCSLAARGPKEDELYSRMTFYRNNIRRGNTIVVNNKSKQVSWGRKGLMKFFDVSQKSINAIINSTKLHKKDKNIHIAIFEQIQKILNFNEQIKPQDKAKCAIFRLNKANGQNAQVSYFKQTDEWIISSKNVSIFISKIQDCKKYQQQRYHFAQLMAQAWFAIIDNKSQQEIVELKSFLRDRTIIGEYCGNPDYQHLVKYSEITIYFYAVVENISKYTCIPPNQTFAFLQKHHLPIVKNYKNSQQGKYDNYVNFGKKLKSLFDQISVSSIFQDQQGSVLYFVLELPFNFIKEVSEHIPQIIAKFASNYKQQQIVSYVSSLGKVKTLQYRIIRKLRQKLKFFIKSGKGNKQGKQKNEDDQKIYEQKYGSFEREVNRLVKEQELSKPIEYYFCVALLAFQYAFKNSYNQSNLQLMSDHYLDFLSVIFWAIQNKKEVTPELMKDKQFHKELRLTTWEEYSTKIVEDYEIMLERMMPKYSKIKKSCKFDEDEQIIDNEDDDDI